VDKTLPVCVDIIRLVGEGRELLLLTLLRPLPVCESLAELPPVV